MKKVKFGLSQITNPTPAFATHVFRFVLYAAAIITLIAQASPDVSESVRDHILTYTALVPTIVHMLSKLCGVDAPDDPSNK